MKYAIIGCGRISHSHMQAAAENHLELVAVCDVEPSQMDDMLKHSAWADDACVARYTDYRKMLDEHPEIKIAAVTTSSGAHAEIAKACMERGIHVLVEKPIALSMREADELAETARRTGVKASVCFQNRFNTPVQETRKALEEGRFGKMSHGHIAVRWYRDRAYYESGAWRGTWAQDGGCLMNQCIHGIDLLRWMMGRVVSVYGVTRQRLHPYIEAEDVGLAVVQFENGSVGTIEGTANVYQDNLEETLSLFGEKGTVRVGGIATDRMDVWKFADEGASSKAGDPHPVSQVNGVYGRGHISLYADMLEAIRTGREPYIPIKEGRDTLELVLAIYKSMKEGRAVTLPIGDFSTMDMKGTF